MAVVMLPAAPSIRRARPMVQSFGGVLKPFLGGPTIKINRLGTRFAFVITMPPMPAEVARHWVAALCVGSDDTVCISIPQDIAIGNPGTPRLSAALTAGMVLPLKELTAGYLVKAGQFLSIIHNGRRYTHIFTADAVVGANGTLNAAIWPMIRTGLSVNDLVEIAEPKVEGRPDVQFEWDILTEPWVQVPDLTISEAA